jgi:hypothetical protein
MRRSGTSFGSCWPPRSLVEASCYADLGMVLMQISLKEQWSEGGPA